MSLSHFFKHLVCKCLCRFPPHPRRPLLRRISPPPAPTRFSHLPLELQSARRRPWKLTPSFHCATSATTPYQESTMASDSDPSSTPYLSVRIFCPKHAADVLSEALLCFGAISTSMDEQDTDETTDKIFISSIFPEGEDVVMCISNAADSIGLKDVPSYEVLVGEQCNWLKRSQELFLPVEVGEGIWIVPEWKCPVDLQATNIILNPGLAFGNGEHPTTRLCLMRLREIVNGGEHFLDYGTGSGILAIAALKFGAALSVGVDIDPQAIRSARWNAGLNDIRPEKLPLHLIPTGSSFPSADKMADENVETVSPGATFIHDRNKYDVIIANILLNPLLELADTIVSYAKPGAIICVSGILSEQIPDIISCYSRLLEAVSVSELDGWACVSGTKRERKT